MRTNRAERWEIDLGVCILLYLASRLGGTCSRTQVIEGMREHGMFVGDVLDSLVQIRVIEDIGRDHVVLRDADVTVLWTAAKKIRAAGVRRTAERKQS